MSQLESQLSKSGSSTAGRSSWTSVAFIVESILLLVFLIASLAILIQVFVASLNKSVESRTLDAATIAASSIAEHFAANPSDVQNETLLGDLRIVCSVQDEPRSSGTLYRAHIDVFDISASGGDAPIYSLDTAHYQRGGA